jgi:hypothetical protein
MIFSNMLVNKKGLLIDGCYFVIQALDGTGKVRNDCSYRSFKHFGLEYIVTRDINDGYFFPKESPNL